jgi:hypothetical protein
MPDMDKKKVKKSALMRLLGMFSPSVDKSKSTLEALGSAEQKVDQQGRVITAEEMRKRLKRKKK